MLLKLVPKSWRSWDFSVLDGAQCIAEFDLSLSREKGTLTVAGVQYSVYREHMASAPS